MPFSRPLRAAIVVAPLLLVISSLAFLAFLGCAIGGAVFAFFLSYLVPSLVEGYPMRCFAAAGVPLLMILLQVSGDACSRYGAADEPRQPAAVQVVQQPRFIYPCAVVRLRRWKLRRSAYLVN